MIVLAGQGKRGIVRAVVARKCELRDLRIIPVDLEVEVVLQCQLNAILQRKRTHRGGGIGLRHGHTAAGREDPQSSQDSHCLPEIEVSIWFRQTNADTSATIPINNYWPGFCPVCRLFRHCVPDSRHRALTKCFTESHDES